MPKSLWGVRQVLMSVVFLLATAHSHAEVNIVPPGSHALLMTGDQLSQLAQDEETLAIYIREAAARLCLNVNRKLSRYVLTALTEQEIALLEKDRDYKATIFEQSDDGIKSIEKTFTVEHKSERELRNLASTRGSGFFLAVLSACFGALTAGWSTLAMPIPGTSPDLLPGIFAGSFGSLTVFCLGVGIYCHVRINRLSSKPASDNVAADMLLPILASEIWCE